MLHNPVEFIIKDGRKCILRIPEEKDAAEMLEYRIKTAGETDYLLNYPEDLADYTIDDQLKFIKGCALSQSVLMLTAFVDGKLAGNCQISFNTKIKIRHRAGIGIALLKEYWGLGIGSVMFSELIKAAENYGEVSQLELEVIEGNEKAIALYKKFGFETVSENPDAIRLKDGTMLKELFMVKKI